MKILPTASNSSNLGLFRWLKEGTFYCLIYSTRSRFRHTKEYKTVFWRMGICLCLWWAPGRMRLRSCSKRLGLYTYQSGHLHAMALKTARGFNKCRRAFHVHRSSWVQTRSSCIQHGKEFPGQRRPKTASLERRPILDPTMDEARHHHR